MYLNEGPASGLVGNECNADARAVDVPCYEEGDGWRRWWYILDLGCGPPCLRGRNVWTNVVKFAESTSRRYGRRCLIVVKRNLRDRRGERS